MPAIVGRSVETLIPLPPSENLTNTALLSKSTFVGASLSEPHQGSALLVAAKSALQADDFYTFLVTT